MDTRFRARDTLTPDEITELYERNNWSLFVQAERDEATIRIGKTFEDIHSIADLSAGGARITPEIAAHFGVTPILGDISHQYGYGIVGPIEETIGQIQPVDLMVCSETLEHLEDPDWVLDLIRPKAARLLVTTPVWEEPHMTAHGHLWTWRQADVEEMFKDAGYEIDYFEEVIQMFGVWKLR